MNRSDFFYRQLLLESELDQAFDDVQTAVEASASEQELGLHGMIQNGDVTENTVPDLNVLVSGDAYGYGPAGKPIRWADPQTVDCSVDLLDVTTEVATPGNSKWLTIFARFKVNPTTPRLDGNGITVYYRMLEDFEIFVAQGAEAVSPTKPALRDDALVLADLLLGYGDTQILNAVINVDRRQDLLRYTGASKGLVAGRVREGFETLLGYYNDHVTDGIDDRHEAEDVDFSFYSWLNSASTVQEAFQEVVDDLESSTDGLGTGLIGYRGVSGAPAGSGSDDLDLMSVQLQSVLDDLHAQLISSEPANNGASRLGAAARTGIDLGIMPAPATLGQGSIAYQLGQLIDLVETMRNRGLLATQVQFTPYQWITSIDMQSVIEEIVDDLADASLLYSGASRIGMHQVEWINSDSLNNWLQQMVEDFYSDAAGFGSNYIGFEGYSWVSSGGLYDAIQEMVIDLGSTAAGTPGASRIGYDGYGPMTAGTLRNALAQLVIALGDTSYPGTVLIGHDGYTGAASSAAPNYSLSDDDLETFLDNMMLEINKRVARAGDTIYGDLIAGNLSVDLGNSGTGAFDRIYGGDIYATGDGNYHYTNGRYIYVTLVGLGATWEDPTARDAYAYPTNGAIYCQGPDSALLPLPGLTVGSRIDNIYFYMYIQTPRIGTHRYYLNRRPWNSPSETVVASAMWTPGGSGYTQRNWTNIYHTVVADNVYWIQYYTTGTGIQFMSCRIELWIEEPNVGRSFIG